MSVTITSSPTRRRTAAIVIAAALLSPPTAAAAQPPDRIDLPAGWMPEGITTDGSSLFVGSLADGAIWRADPSSGEGVILVPGAEGAAVAGLESETAAGRLWAAGANSGEVRAYDSETGELLASYPFEAGFLNDLVATPEAIYITDSFVPQILVIPLAEDGSLPETEQTQALPIGGDLEYGEGFNVNGIVATPAGLVVVHTGSGELFRVDPATGESARIDTGTTTLTAGDGLELDGETLYVVRNQLNQVAVLKLDEGVTSANLEAELTSDDLDVPTTAAINGSDLWAVNARFGTEATPETGYWITRLDTAPPDVE
jgi:outer membrane protein assembly factor BamB